jgi:hypothetical protein
MVQHLRSNTVLPFHHSESPFKSFWMGGYECTDKLNAFGNRVDFLKITGHLERIDEDYRDLSLFDIKTVREGIRWSQVEKRAYDYDWSTVKKMIESGKANGIQQVWDLCHFGFPDDLTPLHPMFARRFAALCRSFVHFYRSIEPDNTLIVTPINEVSFLSWLGGDVRGTSPYCRGNGWEVKYALMRAYIEGVAALKEADPGIRILTTEPLVQMVPPHNATEHQVREAALAHENQYQSVDMLCGRISPELGGSPDFTDILGFNFYYNNQWEHGTYRFLSWTNEPYDSRWRSVGSLLMEAYVRYQRPIALTETSHSGIDRPKRINYVAKECADILEQGVPLWGVCLYPIIDRPDWDHLHPWHCSGIWDAGVVTNDLPGRILHEPSAAALLESQKLIADTMIKISQRQPAASQNIGASSVAI